MSNDHMLFTEIEPLLRKIQIFVFGYLGVETQKGAHIGFCNQKQLLLLNFAKVFIFVK